MDVFEFKFHTSEKSGQKTHYWRHGEFRVLLGLFLLLLGSIQSWILLSQQLFRLPLPSDFSPLFSSPFSSSLFLLLFLLALCPPLRLQQLIDKLMHHDNVRNLVINVVETAFHVIREVLFV